MKKNHPGFNQLKRQYLKDAKRFKTPFKLSDFQFRCLVSKDCFYCGKSPSRVVNRLSVGFIYNGIDKINPRGGYTPTNTVTACRKCNFMKGTLPFDEFIEQVCLIAKRLGSKSR